MLNERMHMFYIRAKSRPKANRQKALSLKSSMSQDMIRAIKKTADAGNQENVNNYKPTFVDFNISDVNNTRNQ